MIRFADGTQAHAICPYNDEKSYDLDESIKSVEHFLEDEIVCTCCLSNIHEVRKTIFRCGYCNTFLCKGCWYKCNVNKTGLCITCKQNFGVKVPITRKDNNIKIESLKFTNFSIFEPKKKKVEIPESESRNVSGEDIKEAIMDDITKGLYEEKTDEFMLRLNEKYGDEVIILIPRPYRKTPDKYDVKDTINRIRATMKTMFMAKKPVIVVFLGLMWGYGLSSKNIAGALFPEMKGVTVMPKCTVLIKDATCDVSYIMKGYSETDPYNVDTIIKDIDNLNLKL